MKVHVILALVFSLISAVIYADCNIPAGKAGAIIYDGDINVVQYCNGTNWVNTSLVKTAVNGSGCTSPTATRGTVMFNDSTNVYQFCNGTAWVNMACSQLATGKAGSGCTSPAAPRTAIIFSPTAGKLQFCDGTNWINTGSLCAAPSSTASCAGTLVGGYCWYASNVGASCTDTCSGHNGNNDATINFVGSAGTDANCEAVATALGVSGVTVTYDRNALAGAGCYYKSGRPAYLVRDTTAPTSYDVAEGPRAATLTRFCACNQ